MKLLFVFFAVIGLSLATPWQPRQSRSLRTDLDEFIAMLPIEKIKEIYHKYESDPDMIKIVAYLKGSEFAKVADIVANVDEIKALVDFLESKDVHIIDVLNKLADILGLPHWPGSFRFHPIHKRQPRSLRDFLNEVEAILPVDDITNFFFEKLANSEDFQELYNKIASSDYQKLHDAALSHPEIVDMLDRVRALGVDVDKVWQTIKDLFGWTYFDRTLKQSRSLRSDLDEFLALLPIDQIKDIFHKYENDPDMVKVIAYLKSKDFAAVVDIVVNVDEVKDLVDYLENKGVHIIDLLNKLADILGLPHWPGSFHVYPVSLRNSRSLRDFLNEVEAILPVDDITNFFFEKLANSEDFQELYNKIASSDYQTLHDAALSHPEIVDMLDRVRALGVDVDKVWQTIKDLFGWTYFARFHRQTRSLRSDLDEFIALLPIDQIKEIYHKYENDPDVLKIIAYLKSTDFAAVVDIVINVDEVKDLVNYLENKDVHIIELLNKLADILGLPHWPGNFHVYPVLLRQNRSIRDVIDEIKAIMPIDDITNFFFEKLANSEDFQELYNKIASTDYQKLHDAALSHPEIVDMIDRLKALGVDVDKVWETIKQLFGWE